MDILVTIHSYLRWVVLALAVAVILKSLAGMSSQKAFTDSDRNSSLFLMISTHTQLLIGLILYFGNGWLNLLTTTEGAMKNPLIRQFGLEHALGMIIGIVLIHLGYTKAKKGVGATETHKAVLIRVVLGLVIILATIPWGSRPMFR